VSSPGGPLFDLVTVLRALAPLFLLILLGAVLRRRGLLPPAAIPTLNGIVVHVTLPALVVVELVSAPELPRAFVVATFALLIAQAGTMLLAFAVGKAMRLSRPALGALMLTGTFGNTGFLGYPITLARPLVAHLMSAAVLQDQFGMSLSLYPGAAIVGATFGDPAAAHPGTGSGHRSARHRRTAAALRFFRSPLFAALVVGLTIRLVPDIVAGISPAAAALLTAAVSATGVQTLIGTLGKALGYLGQGTTPIVLLALGAALRPGAVRRAPRLVAVSCTLKLLVLPVLMWTLCRALAISGPLLSLGVQEAAMPTSVVCSVLCAQTALEGDLAVGIVFATTVCSAVTLPLALALLR
jgi:hypothetical protein